MEIGLVSLVVLPIGLGLFGFVEPCSIGSTLLLIKYLEGRDAATKIMQLTMFAVTRAIFIGALGVVAVVVGAAFVGFQKGAWIALGTVYVAIGVVYLSGRAGLLMTAIGPRVDRIGGMRTSAGLGVLFGLNIPACAAPLLAALLGIAAARGVSGDTLAAGFISLGLFGLALSLPLVVAVLFEPARRVLDRLAGLSRRVPLATGVVLIGLGLWSIGLGLFVETTV